MQRGICYVRGPRGAITQWVIPWGPKGGITGFVIPWGTYPRCDCLAKT